MDSKKNGFEVFLYTFSWKNPLTYIVFLLAFSLYIYLFIYHQNNESFGIIERTKEAKIFLLLIVTTFFTIFFCASPFILQSESILFRGVLLVGAFSLAIVFVLPMWMFDKYDNQKMDSYIRIFPLKMSPHFKYKETLIFTNIKAVEYFSGPTGDDGHALIFLLNNGKKQNIGLNNISHKSKDIFLNNLYQECNWLRDDIESKFGSSEERKMRIEGKKEYAGIDIVHGIFFTFFIWIFLIEITSLIIYTFKIDLPGMHEIIQEMKGLSIWKIFG
jgi:hypothetical protein